MCNLNESANSTRKHPYHSLAQLNNRYSASQQFGFKAYHGCDMATFVVKESINYFLDNGNDFVFGSFLDLSKAYDRVCHPKVFLKLLEHEAPTLS